MKTYDHGIRTGTGTDYDALIAAVGSVRHGLAGSLTLRAVKASTGETVEVAVPADVARVLYDALGLLSAGCGATAVPTKRDLTTTQAANLLGVSRTRLIDMVNEGKLAFHLAGSHRRLRLVDVLEYRRKMERDARDLATAAQLARADDVTGRLVQI